MSEQTTCQQSGSARSDLPALGKLTEDLFNLMGEVTYKRTEEEDPTLKCTAIFYAGLTLTTMHAMLAVFDKSHKWVDEDLKAMHAFLGDLPEDYLVGVVERMRRMGLLEPANEEEVEDGSAEG